MAARRGWRVIEISALSDEEAELAMEAAVATVGALRRARADLHEDVLTEAGTQLLRSAGWE